jgi:hypothetical protein
MATVKQCQNHLREVGTFRIKAVSYKRMWHLIKTIVMLEAIMQGHLERKDREAPINQCWETIMGKALNRQLDQTIKDASLKVK